MRPSQGFFGLLTVLCIAVLSAPAATAQSSAPVGSENPTAEAYRLFLLGRHLENAGEIDAAIRAHREAAELDPEAGEVLAELAALYARRNRAQEAIDAGQAALERDPDNQTAHRILGLIYAARGSAQDATPLDAARAIRHLEQARGTLLPDYQVDLTLARLYLITDVPQQAITLLEELMEDEAGFSEAGLLLARAYEEVGRDADAVTALEGVVRNGRPSSRVLRRLGELYERDARWSDAADVYERAVERNPRSTRTRRQLANALLQDEQPERARDVLRELLQMQPDDAAGLYLLSEVELSLGNHDLAERAARRLITAEPDDIRGPFALAEVLIERRAHRELIETLEPLRQAAADRRLPREQMVRLLARLGFAFEQLQDYDGASRVYEEAAELMPTSLAFGARLVQSYIDAGRMNDARESLTRLQGHHPNNLTLARLHARLLGAEGAVDEGAVVLQEAVDRNAEMPMAHVALAAFYSEHARHDDAAAVLEAAEPRFPGDTTILFQLGAVLERGQRHADAERAFRRVLAHDPEHAATLNYLGYMLADQGERLEESVGLLERAIEIDPHNGAYLDSLGWAYFKLDRLELAETLLQQASDQMQWNSVIQDHLGDVMFRLDRFEEAIAAWGRALAGDGEDVDPAAIEQKIEDAQRRLGR